MGYTATMPTHGNLADPGYEPTDEELEGLMRAAFAGLAEAREESLEAMRARIRVLAAEARARVASAEKEPVPE